MNWKLIPVIWRCRTIIPEVVSGERSQRNLSQTVGPSSISKGQKAMERDEFDDNSTAIVVDYREEGRRHKQFQHLRISDLAFDDVLDRLRNAIREENVAVLHEVDAPAILGKSNYRIGPARQILFFHPRLMARLLREDTAALLEAPLKFSVIAGGSQVFVRWQDPAPSFARYKSEALTELGIELSTVCKRIVDVALGKQ
jgi:uncharacterized protein (DUF302 family)